MSVYQYTQHMFELNTDQQTFVDEADERLGTSGWWTLKGEGGCGKTYAQKALFARRSDIVFLAPTHKAKEVLQKKLGDKAYVITTTKFTKGFKGTKLERMESDIVDAERLGDESLIKKLNKKLTKLIKSGQAQEPVFGVKERDDGEEIKWICVVCDEASMVTLDDRNLIIENSDSAIFVGDDFQVPPVTRIRGDEERQDWFRRIKADWTLTEVVRQKADSSILKLARLIREADDEFEFPIRKWMMENENGEDLFVLDEDKDCYEQASEEDTMMVSFMNDVVDEFSYDVRKCLGRDPNVVTEKDHLYAANNFGEDFRNKDIVQTVGDLSITAGVLAANLNNITTGMKCQTLINTARLKVRMKRSERTELLSSKGLVLRYDYARTIHSSQGSEFRIVMYRHCGTEHLDTLTHNRLLYTAVSRSVESFILLK